MGRSAHTKISLWEILDIDAAGFFYISDVVPNANLQYPSTDIRSTEKTSFIIDEHKVVESKQNWQGYNEFQCYISL